VSAARGWTGDPIDGGAFAGSMEPIVISQSAPIVVGVDGSERSRDALALATRLADPGQHLLLTHVHGYGRLSNLLSGGG
jgi:hypothetical protein